MAINRVLQSSVQSGLPKFDSVWDGISAPSSMDPLGSITLGSSQTTIQFTNIPQTYTHLQLRISGRNTATGSGSVELVTTFNNDSGTNYSRHNIGCYTNTISAPALDNNNSTSISYIRSVSLPKTSDTADVFGVGIVDILDYTNTTKAKTFRFINGIDTNAGTVCCFYFGSGSWFKNTSSVYEAINRIDMNVYNSLGNIDTYSCFSLYGIK